MAGRQVSIVTSKTTGGIEPTCFLCEDSDDKKIVIEVGVILENGNADYEYAHLDCVVAALEITPACLAAR